MSRSEAKTQNVAIADIVQWLSQLRSGILTSLPPQESDASTLKPLVDELNAFVQHTQEQAQALTQRYDYILDGAGLGSWDWWLGTNAVRFDPRWCAILGLHPEETPQILSTWDSRVHPEDKAKAYKDINDCLEGKTPAYENIHRMRHADGHWVWILDRGRISEVDASGKAVRFTGAHLDISELKNMEIRDRQKDSELKEARAIANIGHWSFDLLSQQLSWSSEHYKIFEIEEPQPQEDLYRLYRSRIHKDDLHQLDVMVERASKLGENYSYDHRLVSSDGTIKYVHGIGKVTKNAEGIPVRISGTCQDITERMQREQKSRFILDGLGIGVWEWDPHTNFLEWDDNMYKLYDIERKNFNGAYEAWENSLSPETKAKTIEAIHAAVRGEKDLDTVFQVIRKTGAIQEIRTRAFVVRDENGKALKMHGINVDRTREAELEKSVDRERVKATQNAKLASLGEMSAGIAHEINNPLAIIAGTASVLPKFTNHPEQLAAKINTIQGATERIAKIVKSLRKFSRTSDKTDYKVHSLVDVIKEALVLTASQAKHHDAKIEFEHTSKGYVLCDDIEIEQVCVNLITNAIYAVKELSERWVNLALEERDGGMVLRVRDSGPRISPALAKNLFQPFFTTKPVGQGTGLGLSITKGILDEHRATIELVADDPHTCFEIRFPKEEGTSDAD